MENRQTHSTDDSRVGNFIDLVQCLETVHSPSEGNAWTCKECGEQAKLEKVPR